MRVRDFCARALESTGDQPSPKASGVYVIFNRATMRFYIGKSADIDSRFRSHRETLRTGKHFSAAMQEDWIRYGEDAFRFCTYALVPPADLGPLEDSLISESLGDQCYNRRVGGGRPLSCDELLKIRQIRMIDAQWEDAKLVGMSAIREFIAKAAKKIKAAPTTEGTK